MYIVYTSGLCSAKYVIGFFMKFCTTYHTRRQNKHRFCFDSNNYQFISIALWSFFDPVLQNCVAEKIAKHQQNIIFRFREDYNCSERLKTTTISQLFCDIWNDLDFILKPRCSSIGWRDKFDKRTYPAKYIYCRKLFSFDVFLVRFVTNSYTDTLVSHDVFQKAALCIFEGRCRLPERYK